MSSEDKLRYFLKRVTADLHDVRARLREAEEKAGEPIAIVGTACRYPGGANTPERLWELVAAGTDAIAGFPADRGWDTARLYRPGDPQPGHSYVREGGFLPEAADFDPEFFGISPREAVAMDPQQRLLLEVAHEAFERAGLPVDGLRGSRTGVFVGGMAQISGPSEEQIEALSGYLLTGSAASVFSGRIAYTFGLEGPAVTVDTACSSSLVAMHLAAQALRAGECSLALAGGVTVMTTPEGFVEFSQQSGLATDGRCKAFAEAADGTAWGEGAGMLVLERLSDARRHGHPVLAVLRGSAVNSDGASNGLTAPNGPSQQRVIRAALANARLAPSDVDVVEAHGTGTTLGDPIEAEALLATYGQDRDRPLWLGSLKSNIGHTQAAAGVGGVIKMIEAMRHGVLPRTLHVDAPSSHVDWAAGHVRLLTEAVPWPETGAPRRAGVSSFGVSGTNAHVIIEAVPAEADEPSSPLPVVPWVLSAKTGPALRDLAWALRSCADDPVDVGRALATTRSVREHRSVVLDAAGLDAVADGVSEPANPGDVVFVFPGQGSQWTGMGRELLDASPVFAARMAECATALSPFVDWDLLEALDGDLERVDVVQPVLWAVMVSLAEVWRSYGVEPAAVVGHSQGEIAAAVVAGGLSLEDGARVVALRSKAILRLSGLGGMVSLATSVELARELIAPWGGRISVAAVNGPSSVVVSGETAALDELLASVDVRARRIAVDYASHSAQVELLAEELASVLAEVKPRSGRIPFVSAVTGEVLDTAGLDAAYWYRNLREPVRFDQAVSTLLGLRATVFVECSAHPVLTVGVEETIDQAGVAAAAVGTLRRGDGGLTRLFTSLGEAFARGADVDWAGLFAGTGTRRVTLPTYPFQRDRYWSEPAAPRRRTALDDLRYEVTWRLVPADKSTVDGIWVVCGPDDDLADRIAQGLTRHGAEVIRTTELGDTTGVRGVIAVAPAGRTPSHPDVPAGFAAALALVQADVPLWIVTRGAVSTGAADPVTDPEQALVWGLGQVVRQEQPSRWGGVADLTADADDATVDLFLGALTGPEDELAVRPDGVFARRLTRPAATTARRTWRPDGTTLITGGTGALGAHVARRLAAQGAPHLLLVSRSGRDAEGAADLEAELTGLGARVTVAACDAADRDALGALLGALPTDAPLRAVVHTAAVLDDAVLDELTLDQAARVLRVKAEAAIALHELTRDLDLDAFVLFSSLAGTYGGAGQGNYAPGNAFLDAFARYRRGLGLPATSIGWGHWAGGGMADGGLETRLRQRGVPPMPPELALDGLQRVLDLDDTAVVVADVDWTAAQDPGRLLADLLPRTGNETVEPGLAGLAPAERDRRLLEIVRTQIAAVLGFAEPDRIDPARALRDLGFDSLTAVELRNKLGAAVGLKLPATLVFDHPSPAALVSHLASHFGAAVTSADVVERGAADEPIAIVAMSCRFPGGVGSPEDLWELLAAGRDTVAPFPADRGWDVDAVYDPDPETPGRSYVRHGSFVDDVTGFDAAFFGISPREALAMDPQQRMLLETAWEAFERAGIDPASLRGSRVGVFAGTNGQDYSTLLMNARDQVEGYLGTGSSASVFSGRVAYALGLEGPAVTVDTACSSSLVALHLAAQALRSGECSLALAGGVTVMSTPIGFVEFSRQRGLAADGRCKPFAAAADGTAWGEGAGILLVERLSDAQRLGHPVLAVLRGSAVNSDGASNGLTAPNGPSQQRVIRAALAAAGLTASDVDAVEAHGTGTRLGDPIEAQALLATYGQDRAKPVWLGSVKSNLGHTQAAAGVAGVIKVVEALRNGMLPRTLHVDSPSSQVDWSAGSVRLLTESVAWPAGDRVRRAGVSSFGISGTNAHIVLEESPVAAAPAETFSGSVVPWLVSARTEEGLRAQAGRLLEFLETGPALVGTARTLATGRASLECRAVVLAADLDGFRRGLTGLAEGRTVAEVVRPGLGGKVAFLFSGQGSQRVGMGQELYAAFPVYAAAFDAVCELLDPRLRDFLGSSETEFAQQGIFAVEVALFRLLESWGVRPDAVVGHSVGEIAAAHVAGILSLEDACALVSARGRLMQALPSGGAMIAVQASEVDIELPSGVSLAAVNGRDSVVLSGVESSVTEYAAKFAKTKRLKTSHAFHSALMEPMLAEFAAAIDGLVCAEPSIPFVSTVDESVPSPEYWVRQVREPVRFADAVERLRASGVTGFVELGPDAVLTPMVEGAIPTLAAGRLEEAGVLAAVAHLAVDWARVLGPGPVRTDLPTYAFQHERFWLDAADEPDALRHPLLSAAVELPESGGHVLTGVLSTRKSPWLAGHAVHGTVILPGTAFVELALRAGAEAGCETLEELTIAAPLTLTEPARVQVTIGAADSGRRTVTVHSQRDSGEWTRHATGVLSDAAVVAEDLGEWPPDASEVDVTDLYQGFEDRGFAYGPSFRGLRAAWVHEDSVFAEVALPAADHDAAGRFGLHPALLDAALHGLGLGGLLPDDGQGRLPFTWSGVARHSSGAASLRVRLTPIEPGTVSLTVADGEGRPVLTVASLVLRPVLPQVSDAMFRLEWREAEPGAAAVSSVFLPVEAGDVRTTTAQVLAAIRSWLSDDRDGELVFVTRGAVAAADGDEVPNPAAAAAWGLVRVARSEHPGRFRLVDLDDGSPAPLLPEGEPELAVRAGRILVPRIARGTAGGLELPQGDWQLEVTEPGTVDGIAASSEQAAPLGPGEVRVAVRAAGINFRDLLNVLGRYPGGPVPLGQEAAGVVTDTGEGVTLAPGDRVFGLFPGTFAAHATTDHRLLKPVPAGWTFAQAATTPVAFLTAYYGLVELAELKPGESVLVHAAAGGVGMAAVQLARYLGAEVYGTASPGKHAAVDIDPAHLASSRTLEFAERFPRVDVVLNSLTGEFIDASQKLLADGGRFLEMGKTDLREAPGYRAFDLAEAGADRLGRMFTEVLDLFAAGHLRPLPVRAWDIRHAPDALRYLSQAKHVGKLALTVPRALDPDGTVLITGGTGALGAALARHLVRNGAKHVVLASRRGIEAPGAKELEAELPEVTVATCDVADREAVAELVKRLPLTAVVHAAGVLADATVDRLTEDDLAEVLAPKADGARHLHELTRDADLAAFVLFSSVSGLAGTAGQGAYAAANAYLDALAAHRRAEGLPGTSIAWGAWETGMAGELTEADRARMSRSGLLPLSTEDGMGLFDAAVGDAASLLVPMRLDPAALRGDDVPALLRGLVRARPQRPAAPSDAAGLVRRLGGRTPAEQDGIVLDLVREAMAAVLGHADATGVDPGRGFLEVGFDSLTAVELRNRLATATGLRLPSTLVFDHASPAELAAHLRGELTGTEPDADRLLSEVDSLETRLLAAELDDAARAAVHGRLQTLLAKWSGTAGAATVPDSLATASADDLFDFIDNALGS
ncbi:acyl transferase domain-containing protein/acyl carrier protein [Amycolatopsis lexingtonensis]|uniref:Acyl transferase domain-containing protein/acyl carrier protein n=1 Tax=Amycolatopsis lexingtonensis TaxID=218822 RepID=A0ABR9IEX4_9PSEU|nr:type I polyketide synthase [Amycolatopsis lexingtonensis]MBE1501728.1 acyl transferase domain-containing protein/acyl carrier protein [Amycolatopsis lexingtonensis]